MQSDRLKKALAFLKENGVEASGSYQKIAGKTGYNPNYISDLVNGRFAISDKFADRFQEAYSISRKWLQTGEGDMVYSAPVRYPQNHNPAANASDMNISGRYLNGEEINMKLIGEYNNIILILQSHINQLTEQNMTMANEIAELRKFIGERK